MKHTHPTPQEQKRQNGLSVILSLALLFLSVVLAINLKTQLSHGLTLQAVIHILAILLFCGVGLALLGGVIRRSRSARKHNTSQEEFHHVHGKH